MTTGIPPAPEGPSELDALREMLKFANQAVDCMDTGAHHAAALSFYRSWQTMARHMLTDTLESEDRGTAWDRVAELGGKLDQIRELVTDEAVLDGSDFLLARIREVLDR